jgi:uncharacterized protein involved in exopolysaccharide biosynthesis
MDNRDHGRSNAGWASFALRHAKFMSTAAIVGGFMISTYSIVSGPVYTAYCQVLVDPGISKIGRENWLGQGGAPDTQRVESEIAVIKSDGVALAVIDKLKISPRSDFFNLPLLHAFQRPNDSNDNATERRLALAQFRESLTVRRIGVSDAIAIGFSASTADQAAERANATAEAYMKFQLEARAQAARASSDWLQHRLFQIRLEMNRAELKLQEFRAGQNYSLNNKRLATISARQSGDVPEKLPGTTSMAETGDLEAMTLEELETNAAAHRKVYETFLQAYMTTVQDQSFPIPSARLISRAEPPMRQNGNILFAIGAMIILGGIGAMSPRIWQLRNSSS